MILVRPETNADHAQVFCINESAFETNAEAKLVDALRDQADPIVSLVAEIDGHVVGHIMFSPVSHSEHTELFLMGLAPMAVLPEYQRSGVGSELVRAGIDACRKIGSAGIVVLGHPAYYPKFGFVPSTQFGFGCEYEVPEEAFMAIELIAGTLIQPGVVRYHKAFSELD